MINKFSEDEILNNRIKIKEEFLQEMKLDSEHLVNESNDILYCLFNLYDRYFFNNYFQDNNFKFTFQFSKKMTRAAGYIRYKRLCCLLDSSFKFKFSSYFIFRNFLEKGSTELVNGITAFSRLEVLMYVMEHEICHLIDAIARGSSNHDRIFKWLTYNCFRHNSIFHSISREEKIANNEDPKKIFERNAKKIDVPYDWFGKKLKIDNTIFTICEIKPQNYRYPILAESKNHNRFKLTPLQVIKFSIEE